MKKEQAKVENDCGDELPDNLTNVLALLGKTEDIKNIGYNVNQSVTTIASGGITGKGFLEGERTQGDFVPEQQTDYILTTVGEEWGFLGSTAVIILFVLFLLRIILKLSMNNRHNCHVKRL